MPKKLSINQQATQFLIYKAENADIRVDVLLEDENIWLSMEQMGEGNPPIEKNLKTKNNKNIIT